MLRDRATLALTKERGIPVGAGIGSPLLRCPPMLGSSAGSLTSRPEYRYTPARTANGTYLSAPPMPHDTSDSTPKRDSRCSISRTISATDGWPGWCRWRVLRRSGTVPTGSHRLADTPQHKRHRHPRLRRRRYEDCRHTGEDPAERRSRMGVVEEGRGAR